MIKITQLIKSVSLEISIQLLDIFFPKRCVCCRKFGAYLCFDCAKEIEYIKTDTCPECGKISHGAKYCRNCRARAKTKLSSLIIAANYHCPPVKEMIHNLKYCGLTELSEHLGEILCQKLSSIDSKNYIIVPVPLYKKRQNSRGFNQSALIARYTAQKLGLEYADCLKRLRDTKPQVELKRGERQKNVLDSFKCASSIVERRNVLLIDDVATTGATLSECAKALKTAGAKKIIAAVVARNV